MFRIYTYRNLRLLHGIPRTTYARELRTWLLRFDIANYCELSRYLDEDRDSARDVGTPQRINFTCAPCENFSNPPFRATIYVIRA